MKKNNNKILNPLLLIFLVILIIIGLLLGTKFNKGSNDKNGNKNNTNVKAESTVIDLTKECINKKEECDKDIEISNNKDKIIFKAKLHNTIDEIGTPSYQVDVTVKNITILQANYVNGVGELKLIQAALLDNNILVIEYTITTHVTQTYRLYYNPKKELVQKILIKDDNFDLTSTNKITDKEITYYEFEENEEMYTTKTTTAKVFVLTIDEKGNYTIKRIEDKKAKYLGAQS